jgi:hypothetical protein
LFDLVMAIIFVLFFVTVDDTSPFFFERESGCHFAFAS